MMLSSKGSWSTCILQGLSTFLHTAFTAHTDEAIEGHRGDMADHRAELQTQTSMRGEQRIAGHLWPHLTIAQDEVGRTVNTAWHVVHWSRQMVIPPSRTRT